MIRHIFIIRILRMNQKMLRHRRSFQNKYTSLQFVSTIVLIIHITLLRKRRLQIYFTKLLAWLSLTNRVKERIRRRVLGIVKYIRDEKSTSQLLATEVFPLKGNPRPGWVPVSDLSASGRSEAAMAIAGVTVPSARATFDLLFFPNDHSTCELCK